MNPPGVRRLRLFVAVWPPPEVVEAVAAVATGDGAVRWVPPERWHVTLRFLGDVDPSAVEALASRLAAAAAGVPPGRAVAGPATKRLGRSVLAVPVAQLDAAAAAAREATAGVGGPEERPFFGHLTVARSRGRRPVPAGLAGRPVSATWAVSDITLVRSTPGPGGPVYQVLARAPVAAA